MPPKLIYADFNDLGEDGCLPLTCAGSRRSIAQATALQDGERVWLSDGEATMQARVRPRSAWFGSYWEAFDVRDLGSTS